MTNLNQPGIIKNGLGAVQKPRRVRIDPTTGLVPQKALGDLHTDLQALATAINGNLSLGDGTNGSIMGNLNGQVFQLTLAGVADQVYNLFHGLNRIPIGFFIFNKTKDGGGILADVYSFSPQSWTITQAQVAASNASLGLVYLFLF